MFAFLGHYIMQLVCMERDCLTLLHDKEIKEHVKITFSKQFSRLNYLVQGPLMVLFENYNKVGLKVVPGIGIC